MSQTQGLGPLDPPFQPGDRPAALTLVGSNNLRIPARVWQANAGRSLAVGPVGGAGPVYGITTSPNAYLAWPAKDAAEFLDYSLSFAGWIGSEGDSISRVSCLFTDTNLALLSQVATSSGVTFWFAGGTPGVNDLVDVTAVTTAGRVGRFSVTLPVAPLDAVELSNYIPPTPVLAPMMVLGRAADGSGPPEPLFLGSGFVLVGNVLSVNTTGENTQGERGPAGPPVSLAVGEVLAVPSGTAPSASITGTGASLTLNMSLETGQAGEPGGVGNVGPAPTITIGTVTELAPNAEPTATLTPNADGSAGYALNLGIPQGLPGPDGAASQVPGPKGDKGDQGPDGVVGPQPVDLYVFVPGQADPGQVLLSIILAREVTFPADLAGSALTLLTKAAQPLVVSVTQNGIQVGTASVPADAFNATMASAGFLGSPGDVLQIVAPNPADTTAAGFQVTLTGTR